MSSMSKNDAKKPLVTKASENHTSETHVTGVYTPYILPLAMTSCATTYYVLIESQ